MPTYEYVCKTCGEHMEVFQPFSARPLKKHKGDCGGELKKVFHARGIVFKGGGFYATDSRPSTSTKSDEKSEKKSEKSEKKSEKKSETAGKSEKSATKTGASKSDD